MWLVVGLGNPGREYAGNRHNVGFMVVDELAARARRRRCARSSAPSSARRPFAASASFCCKPMEFMNVSGQAVARVAEFCKIAPESIIVVHDELDLPFGRLKLGAGGGHGGHNGVRSVIADLGSGGLPARALRHRPAGAGRGRGQPRAGRFLARRAERAARSALRRGRRRRGDPRQRPHGRDEPIQRQEERQDRKDQIRRSPTTVRSGDAQ